MEQISQKSENLVSIILKEKIYPSTVNNRKIFLVGLYSDR